MSSTDSKMSIEEIDKQLQSVNDSLAQFDNVSSPLENELNAIKFISNSIQEEFNEKVQALQAEMEKQLEVQRKTQENKTDLLRQLKAKRRSLDNNASELLRKREELAKYQTALEATQLLEDRWKNKLAGARWREWAKDYQLIASRQWAQQKTMILADEMGLGKTLEAIIGIDYIKVATEDASPDNPYEADEQQVYTKNEESGEYEYQTNYVNGVERPSGLRILYLCPSSLIRNVVNEFHHWAPHRSIVPIGNIPQAQRDFAIEIGHEHDEFVMILNYEAWRYGMDTLINKLVKLNFDTIILDEAHNFKDTRTTVYKGIDQLAGRAKIDFVLPMTGTPILNKPEDVFPLLHIIDRMRFYDKSSYLNEFCREIWKESGKKWEFKPGGVQRLGERLNKKYLRRTVKDAGIDLPKQTVTVHEIPVNLDGYKEQARARESMREHAMIMLKSEDEYGNKKSINAMATIAIYTRLRQIETWPAGIILRNNKGEETERLDVRESQKLDYILTLGNETTGEDANGLLRDCFDSNQRVLVFSQFVEPLLELHSRIESLGYRPALLTGKTSMDERQAIHRDFDKKYQDPDRAHSYDVALCHYKVGGVGFNLTGATRTIILDEEWNPGKRDQAYKRTLRIGQDEETHVDVLRMEKTIDSWLGGIMEEKEALVQGFESLGMPDLADYLKNSNDSGLL